MDYFHYLFAIIVIILILWMYYSTKPVPVTTSPVVVPPAERMISANTFARFSRGYNGQTGGNAGTYSDAMRQLNEAETMSLASVDTDTRSMGDTRTLKS